MEGTDSLIHDEPKGPGRLVQSPRGGSTVIERSMSSDAEPTNNEAAMKMGGDGLQCKEKQRMAVCDDKKNQIVGGLDLITLTLTLILLIPF